MGRAAILAGIDASAWAGVALFSRNGTTVTAPALASLHDGGHYPDAVALLNGWSAYRTFRSGLVAQWSGTGTPTAGINSAGFFYVSRYGAGAASFTCTPGSEDPWGWGGAVASTGPVGGTYTCTATRPFTRGPFDVTTNAQFTITGTLLSETTPVYEGVHHSLPTWLTGPTAADNDDVSETLEKWDNDANDAGSKRITWGIDADGRTFTSRPTGLGAGYAITWSSTTFRNMLGFDGTETEVSSGGRYVLTSNYPAQGVLILRNGLAILDPMSINDGAALRLHSGRVAGRKFSEWKEIAVQATLDGGVGLLESTSTYADEAEIYLRRVAPHLWPGARATVLPDWSDPRLGASLVQQFTDGVLTPVLYSAQVRGDVAGVRGRRRCEVSTDAARTHMTSFAPGAPRTITAPLTWRFTVLSDA